MNSVPETILRDWQRSPEIGELSERLFQYISDKNNWQHYFSFGFFKEKMQADEKSLAAALQYLSSPKWEVLHQVFLYFDENDEAHEVGLAEMAEYYAANEFPHPVSGKIIKDLNDISVVFEVGAYFRNHEGGQS